MSTVQVADQTFVAASATAVAALVADRTRWRRWFPDLTVTVREDRSDKGIRWAVDGALTGTMEVWLEPMLDGVIVHYFLHAEPVGDTRAAAAITHARRVAGKTMSFEIKAELDRGRAAGESPGTGGTDPAVR